MMSTRLESSGSAGFLWGLTSLLSRKSRSRHTTPRSTNVLDEDTFTAPPYLTRVAADVPSPGDPLLETPLAPLVGPISTEPSEEQTLDLSSRGEYRQILGADLTLPIFDGKSMNTADHLIDLNTPSMETALDVRMYFWTIGDRMEEDEVSLKHTWDQAKVYDDKVVRAGRLYLKACRDRGHGYFLNNTRHLAWFNQHGNPWYRMPAFGVVNDLLDRRLLPEEGEGFFLNLHGGDRTEQDQMEMDLFMLTNIRMPLLWASFESDEFRQGSGNWNHAILAMYDELNPLARLLYEYGREGVMDRFFFLRDLYTDRAGRDALIAREWPTEEPESSDHEPIDILKLTGGTAKEFITGKKPFLSRVKSMTQFGRRK